MTGREASKRLAVTKAEALDQLDALSREIMIEAVKPLRDVAAVWASGSGDGREKAAAVLQAAGEYAIRPWLAAFGDVPAGRRLEGAEPVLELYHAAQERVIRVLRPMLDDTTPIPPPTFVDMSEEKRPATRVCDEAYLLLRRLLKTDEEQDVRTLVEHVYLHLPSAKRDVEIRRYREKCEWSPLAETDEDNR